MNSPRSSGRAALRAAFAAAAVLTAAVRNLPAQYSGAEPAAPASAAPAAAAPAAGEQHFPGDGHDHGPHDGHDHGPGDGHAHGPHDGHEHHAGDGHDHGPAGIPSRPGFAFDLWERAAVQEGGLEKSLYTLARETVRELTGKVNYGGREPVENLFSLAFEPELWVREPLLKIRHAELRKAFGGEEKLKASHYRVSAMDLENARPNWMPLAERKDSKGEEIKTELNHLFAKLDLLAMPSQRLTLAPSRNFKGENETWRTLDDLASRKVERTPAEEKLIGAWGDLRAAFLRKDAAGFNSASNAALDALSAMRVEDHPAQWRVNLDRWDSKTGLFRQAGWVYLFSTILFTASLFIKARKLAWTAGGLLGLGTLLHIAALVVRGVLAQRTPVANLFESAVFIIAAISVISIAVAAYYRARIVGLAGAALGAFFMGIANNIPLQYGRKILPLVDALQSYWLHLHVTSMLISYAFFAVALFVALGYVVRRAFLKRTGVANLEEDPGLLYLDSLNFRVITIGFPVLTGGVILGAVWAAEAWGRPWGFDPKETAAAITWMIYALYLHCRLFLGWRGNKGIWLSILGAGAVLFTYLGVSFFLPGLHSYVSEGESFSAFLRRIIPGI